MTKIQIKKSHDTAKTEVLDFRHIVNGAGSGEKTIENYGCRSNLTERAFLELSRFINCITFLYTIIAVSLFARDICGFTAKAHSLQLFKTQSD